MSRHCPKLLLVVIHLDNYAITFCDEPAGRAQVTPEGTLVSVNCTVNRLTNFIKITNHGRDY